MTEAIKTEEIHEQEIIAETGTAKPYTFRKLSAEDMFLMFRIIGKIGVNEFKTALDSDTLRQLGGALKGEDVDESALSAVGLTAALDIVNVLLNNLPKCEREIYQLLAQVAGITEDDVKRDAIVFTEMVIDFVKKEEFPSFIKVVSKLFK